MKSKVREKSDRLRSILLSFLVPPKFGDQEESVIASLLVQFLVPLVVLLPLIAVVAIIWIPVLATRWLILLSTSWVAVTSAMMLIQRGKPRLAGVVTLSGFWLIISFFSLTADGVKAPILAAYLVLVLGAGLLLGAKAGYATALLCILTESAFLYLGRFVNVPGTLFQRSDSLIWAVNVFFALVVAIFQHVASHNFRGALHRADSELAERKRTEASLRQSEERYSRLSQATFEGIVASENDIIVDVNDQALNMFGCTSDEMVGKNLLKFLGPGSTGPGLQLVASDTGGAYEHQALKKDGTTFPVETRTRSLIFDGHEMKLTTIRDIAERRRADLLQNAVYMISQAPDKSRTLEELYRNVHEIISRVMPANNFYIAFYDDKEDVVSFPYFVDEVDKSLPPHRSGKGLTEYVIRTGKSLMCDETTDRELTQQGEIELVGTQSTIWIGVPLKVDGKTLGVMAVQHYTDPNAYGERDMKMLEYVSEQVARAIARKRADDASQRERILLRTLVDNLPNPVCVKNRQHQITLANPAYVRYVSMSTGRTELDSEEKILGRTDFEIYPRGLAESNFRDDQKVIRDGLQILDREAYQVDPGGRPHWELLSKIPMRDGSKRIIGLVGIGTDITERKLAEEDLRQLNAFNEMLIQTFPFGIEIVDEDGKILFLSDRMKSILGYDAGGRQCWEIYRDNKQRCEGCPLQNHISVGESKGIEVSGMLNGRTVMINHTGFRYNGKKALLEVMQDVTENKKLERQFLQAQKLEGLGNIAAGIAHDFNNILGVILGYAEMLNEAASETGRSRNGLQAIMSSATRGKSLVSQLLMFARKTEATFQPVQVNEIIVEIGTLLSATFPKTIQITTSLTGDIPRITADPNQLHQVLLNICVNARDAMPGGGILSISTSTVPIEKLAAKHPSATASQYVGLEIRDTGVGMDDETRARIFEPFFSTKDVGKGTGLGLSVVYGIVESHQGFVEVASEKGKGTAITIYFPVNEIQDEPQTRPETKSALLPGGTETILLIEDEDMLRDLVESILSSNGYKVVTAGDGEGGVEVFRSSKETIGAVLSDLGLPRLSGQEVVAKIKQIDPGAKVVIASGYISPDVKDRLEGLGVNAFVQKPYLSQEVLNAVRKTIDSKC